MAPSLACTGPAAVMSIAYADIVSPLASMRHIAAAIRRASAPTAWRFVPSRSRPCAEAVQRMRIVHQDRITDAWVGCPVGEHVEQLADIGHRAPESDVWPVRTPHTAVRGDIEQRLGERDGVGVRRRLRQSVHPIEFHPAAIGGGLEKLVPAR